MYRFRRRSMDLGKNFLVIVALLSMFGCLLQTQRPYSSGSYEPESKTEETAAPPSARETTATTRSNLTQYASNRAVNVDVNVPHTVDVGIPFDYVIRVTNLTNDVVKDVTVIDTLPHNMEVESSVPGMEEFTQGTAKWYLGDLGPREEEIIQVTGIPTSEGVLDFCTDIKYVLPPVCIATQAVRSALEITKTMPPEAMICETIPITIIVTNPGTGIAQNVVVEEPLPSGLRTLDGKSEVVFNVGPLQAGESRTLTLDTRADETGMYENVATATGSNGLHAESNIVTTVVKQPALNITKTGPERSFLGRNIDYDIEVSNVGDAPAESLVIEDTIPSNTTFVSASDGGSHMTGKVTWNLGTLFPQDSAKVGLTLRSSTIGKDKNTAIAKADCAEAVAASATTRVLGIPAILLEVVDLEDPINVGSIVTYMITVTNQGSATGTNIKIECILEGDTMEYVSSTGATIGFAVDNTIIFDPLESLAPKNKASWNLKVKAINSGDVRFKLRMNSDQIERDVIETEATNFYQ